MSGFVRFNWPFPDGFPARNACNEKIWRFILYPGSVVCLPARLANKALAPANHNSLHCWWSVVCLQSLMIRSTAECIVVFLCLGASNITGSLVSGAQDRITNVLWLKQLCSSAKDKEV